MNVRIERIKRSMKKTKDSIARTWEENPLVVISVAAIAMTASAKLLDSITKTRNAGAWKREVARRDRITRKS